MSQKELTIALFKGLVHTLVAIGVTIALFIISMP